MPHGKGDHERVHAGQRRREAVRPGDVDRSHLDSAALVSWQGREVGIDR